MLLLLLLLPLPSQLHGAYKWRDVSAEMVGQLLLLFWTHLTGGGVSTGPPGASWPLEMSRCLRLHFQIGIVVPLSSMLVIERAFNEMFYYWQRHSLVILSYLSFPTGHVFSTRSRKTTRVKQNCFSPRIKLRQISTLISDSPEAQVCLEW